MYLKHLKRDLSLSRLGICGLTGRSKVIIDFLNENLTGLNQYTSDNYPNYIFFGKSKENITLDYDEKNGHLYISYDKIWSFFENDLSIKRTDIQEIIRWWAVDTLKLKVNNIWHDRHSLPSDTVDTLKLKVN